MFSPVRLALSSSFLLFSASVSSADSPSPILAPEIVAPRVQEAQTSHLQVETTPSTQGIHLKVDVANTEVTPVLIAIANKANLQIVIKDGVKAVLHNLSLRDSTPEKALQTVCRATSLNCELRDGVWVISPKETKTDEANTPKIIDSLVFEDVDIEQLLSLIATQFDVPIAISHEVNGKIPYIRLQNKTPRQAIEVIAQVAGLKLQEALDGTFILSKPAQPIVPPPLAPPIEPPTPESVPPSPYHLLDSAKAKQ